MASGELSMKNRPSFARLRLGLWLASLITLAQFVSPVALQQPVANQQAGTPTQSAAAPAVDLTEQLVAIEKAIDAKRKELGIPGVSLAIVKDDKIIYIRGLGVKDLERNRPVTPDTLFAIGSATKAFTALATVITVDEAKLSLNDSPKKFLPYFKLKDQDADARITIRDLLSHRSGLNRTDLAMATNKLNREELIRVAAMAKPTAKLGEKFQYQNVMYAAAGEVMAKAQQSTWDEVLATRIFKPLGMSATNTTVAAMKKSRDYSFGYEYSGTTKETRRLPMREITAAAPAGAINSNARDMAQWLRFMLAGGVANGQRLVSEKNFNELTSKQINVAGQIDYGLGWFLRQWDGHKVIEHGGNIDGFNAQVAMMPDQKLGFVLLTNVTASPLVSSAMNTVWSNLVGSAKKAAVKNVEGAPGAAVDANAEVGVYRLQPGVDFDVSRKDGKLLLTVPGQPAYALENLSGRRYKLGDPAPPGFFATFRAVKDKATETEMYLEQPQGNITALRVKASAIGTDHPAEIGENYAGPLKDLLGPYENEKSQGIIEIGVKDGKVSLIISGQPPYPLVEKEKDKLLSPSLPDSYWVDIKRDREGLVSEIVINQPEGTFPFRRVSSAKGTITVDELLARTIAAFGGQENLRKHRSSVMKVEIDMESQGVKGEGLIQAKAPNMTGSRLNLLALNKKIGSIVSYFDGASGGDRLSFAPEQTYSGKRLADVKIEAGFYGPLSWKDSFDKITIKRVTKVGDEDAYVVVKTAAKGHAVTDYVSTKSFLVLRRDTVISSETSGIEIPQTETFRDYRTVDGVMIPFEISASNVANGDIVTRVKDVKFDVQIPDSVFRKPQANHLGKKARKSKFH